MPANLQDISDHTLILPEFLILDASIILELTPDPTRSHKNHLIAVDFLNRLRMAAKGDQVIPILPLLALEECYFKLCKRALIAYATLAGVSWENYYKTNPVIIRSIYPALEQLYKALLAFPIIITEPEDLAIQSKGNKAPLASRIGDLVYQFAVLPKDATILSEAERLGVYTVATLDSDWSRADGFTVICPF